MSVVEDRMAALDLAVVAKRRRGSLRREIHSMSTQAGFWRLGELLAADSDDIRGQQVFRLLQWPRRSGSVRARRVWRMAERADRWPPDKRVEELTLAQRQRLADVCLREGLRSA